MKLQNAHNHSTMNSNPPPSSSSSSTISNPTSSIIHQSLPSLSSTSEISLDLPILKLDGTSIDSSSTDEPIVNIPTESIQRSSKIESDVFKIVEQTRRNSRTDHKNYGRYFTADGTGTHSTNPSSSSSINPSSIKSSPSTTIIKRMSWNNEPINKTDSTTTIPNNELSNTNSFRSVHSSSGVSSTGSFLFSADEESSITTTTSSSIPAILPSTINKNDDLTDELDEFDGKSSSSTVVGTDDHEHLPNPILSYEQNSTELINSDMIDNTNNRLSTASTNTLTPSSNNQAIIGISKLILKLSIPFFLLFLVEPIPTSNTHISSPESFLRRTPYASVKKRNPTNTHHRSGPQQQPFRRHRIFDENDLRSSTHTVVYDSSKNLNNTSTIIPIRRALILPDDNNMMISSFIGSGNESDYDNNQCNNDYRYLSSSTRLIKIPVNDFNQSDELTRTDDLLLGDQNEIILNNNSNIHSINNNNNNDDDNDNTEARVDLSDDNDADDIDADENTINNNQQSDNNIISSTNSLQISSNHRSNNRNLIKPATTTTSTLDDSAPPPNYIAYRKDPLTTRKLLDIRSHLLLNTTLDAT